MGNYIGSTTLQTSYMWSCRVSIHVSYDSEILVDTKEKLLHLYPGDDIRMFIVILLMTTTTMETTQMPIVKKTDKICALEIYEAVKSELIITTYKI